jgi:hypothetical protein
MCYKTVDITENDGSSLVVRRVICVRDYILVTTQIEFVIPYKSANFWVSPEVSGFFRRNLLLQLVKNGVIEDLLLMKVQLMALFTV